MITSKPKLKIDMGWYETCRLCGKEGKYGVSCNCYDLEMERNIKRTIGCTVVDAFICEDIFFQKFATPKGEIFYLRTGGEEQYSRKMWEVTAEEFYAQRE